MSPRRNPTGRKASERSEEGLFAAQGRPIAVQKRQSWWKFFIRGLVTVWSGAVVLALIDEFGAIPHITFLLTMGITGLLVGSTFVMTREANRVRDDDLPDPGQEGDETTDGLTGLPTYNYFSRRLGDEFARTRRIGRQLSVVLVDVNNLTAVNKEYGVRAGDEVLRHVGRVIGETKRYSDVAARLGDDEFGVILLDTGDVGVDAFIQRLEDRLARESASADVEGRTISLWAGVCSGSAVLGPTMSTADQLLEAAMGTLDGAKQDRERRRRVWMSA